MNAITFYIAYYYTLFDSFYKQTLFIKQEIHLRVLVISDEK